MGENKTITIKDVAKEAGVGVGTVSRVLNNDSHVSPKTREIVEQAMERLDYKPNLFARGLKSNNSRSIGVIVADITNPVFSKVIRGIEENLHKKGFGMFLFDTEMQEEKVYQSINIMEEKKVEGIFILGEHFDKEKLKKLISLNIPVVTVTTQIPIYGRGIPGNFASITINNERAAYSATDFLCKKGMKKIALLMSAEDDENVGKDRYQGFYNALKDNGIEFNPELVCFNERLSMESGYRGIFKLHEKKIKFDSVFAISDLSALGAIRALFELGYRVPEDIAVVGFDGIEQGIYSIPSLTTIDQPRFLMGQTAANIMLDMVNKKKVISREAILDFEFIERESTGQ
ncbi:MAG: LacI family DNA-binding transcriptional regulator [Eubacteriales bacterium]|nr:LacI family DNA-binding transcriptional regulator [Eubacteriales bacterium]